MKDAVQKLNKDLRHENFVRYKEKIYLQPYDISIRNIGSEFQTVSSQRKKEN